MKKKLEYQQYFDQKLNLEKKVNTIATLRGIIFIVMIMSFILITIFIKRKAVAEQCLLMLKILIWKMINM